MPAFLGVVGEEGNRVREQKKTGDCKIFAGWFIRQSINL